MHEFKKVVLSGLCTSRLRTTLHRAYYSSHHYACKHSLSTLFWQLAFFLKMIRAHKNSVHVHCNSKDFFHMESSQTYYTCILTIFTLLLILKLPTPRGQKVNPNHLSQIPAAGWKLLAEPSEGPVQGRPLHLWPDGEKTHIAKIPAWGKASSPLQKQTNNLSH